MDKKRRQLEMETLPVIENFISHIEFGTDLKYNDVEIYDAIENLYDLYSLIKIEKEKRK